MSKWMNVPDFQWLQDRPSDGTFLRGMTIGLDIAKQKAHERRQSIMLDAELRSLQLRERQFEEQLKAKELSVEGMSALTGTISKWASAKSLDSPEAEAEFWDVARQYPYAQSSPNFDNLSNIFQRARDYKHRRNLLTTTIEGRKEVEGVRQEGQTERLMERFRHLSTLQEDSQEFKTEYQKLQHEFNLKRDAAKTTAKGSSAATRFDLLDSDRIAYQAELKSLQSAFEERMLKDADGKPVKDYSEYQKVEQAVIEKYRERARKAPATAPKVEVEAPPAPGADVEAEAERYGFEVPQEEKRVLKFNPATGKIE